MLQVIGEIFKILWKIIVFAGKAIGWFCVTLTDIVLGTCKLLGVSMINNAFLQFLCFFGICTFYGSILSLIPETIIYLLCPLTKKYKSLKNENEKRKYREKHTFLFLKLILKEIRKSQYKRQMMEKSRNKSKETSLLKNNTDTNTIENVIEKCKSNNALEESNTLEKINSEENNRQIEANTLVSNTQEENNVQTENNVPVVNNEAETNEIEILPIEEIDNEQSMENVANTCTFAPKMHPNVIDADLPILFDEDVQELENELNDNNTKTSDIKILYTSNIIGNALRNGTVVKRRLLQTDKPFLVDFSQQPPKEIITENACDGLSVQATIKGQKIEMALEDPNLLNNPVLFNEMTKEELKELKGQLASDMKYKSTLRSFFTMNKKALELKKH